MKERNAVVDDHRVIPFEPISLWKARKIMCQKFFNLFYVRLNYLILIGY